MDNFLVMAHTTLQILIRHTQGSSGTVIWKERVRKYGLMGESMKETSKMERKMEKVCSSGPMELGTLGLGEMVNSMELEYG